MKMDIRYSNHPNDVKHYTTEELREHFLIQDLFVPGNLKMVYSHNDRIITGAACPTAPIVLEADKKDLGSEFFLERREIGIINIGGAGTVSVDGEVFTLEAKDGLYIGLGIKEVIFNSVDSENPAKFYFNSTPAHKSYPTKKINIQDAIPEHLGTIEQSNVRTIYKYIVPGGVDSCQLVMGMTILEPGSMWNTMPCHTHERRMEVYFYFDLAESNVIHLMGQPNETRHIIMRNEEAVISPSWSIHSGVGTKNYTFIWGMAGENQTFSDMDPVDLKNDFK